MAIQHGIAGKSLKNQIKLYDGCRILGLIFLILSLFNSHLIFFSLAFWGVSSLLRPKNYKSLQKGLQGETKMAQVLQNLPSGWRVLHDLDLGGENVDHLAIGPSGVFNIEVKNHSGKIHASPKGLFNKGRRQDKIVRQTWRQAHKLRELLGVEVVPLLVFVTENLEGSQVGRLKVFKPEECVAHLKSLPRVWDYQEFLSTVQKAEKLVK